MFLHLCVISQGDGRRYPQPVQGVIPLGHDRGTPPLTRTGGTPTAQTEIPSRARTAGTLLPLHPRPKTREINAATPLVISLLRSRRRTFLLKLNFFVNR